MSRILRAVDWAGRWLCVGIVILAGTAIALGIMSWRVGTYFAAVKMRELGIEPEAWAKEEGLR